MLHQSIAFPKIKMSGHVDSQVPLIKNTPSFSREKKTQQNKHKSIEGSRGEKESDFTFCEIPNEILLGRNGRVAKKWLSNNHSNKTKGVRTSLTNQANQGRQVTTFSQELVQVQEVHLHNIAPKKRVANFVLLVQDVRCQFKT